MDHLSHNSLQPWKVSNVSFCFHSLWLSCQTLPTPCQLVYMQLWSSVCLKTCLCIYLKERFATLVCNMYLSSLSSHCVLLFSYSAKRSFLHTNHTVFVTATRPLYNKPVASQDQHQVFSGSYVALVRKRIPAILEKKTGQYNVKRDTESYFFSSVAEMRFCTLIIFKNSNQILYVPGFPTRGQQTFFEKRILRTWSISCCFPRLSSSKTVAGQPGFCIVFFHLLDF